MNDSDLILAFDASTQVTVVALGTAAGELLGHREMPAMPGRSNQASTLLVPNIEALATETGIAMSDIRLVATGRGPGTFTGSRVAVATAKGLAFGLGARALGVSTLASVAASLPEADAEAKAKGIEMVVGLLDARRGEVYAAAFEWPSLAPTGPQSCVPPTSLLASMGVDISRPEVCALGTGVGPAKEILDAAGTTVVATPGPSARGLWRASLAAMGRDEMVEPDDLEVVYLRETYAQMGLNPPKRVPYRSPFI